MNNSTELSHELVTSRLKDAVARRDRLVLELDRALRRQLEDLEERLEASINEAKLARAETVEAELQRDWTREDADAQLAALTSQVQALSEQLAGTDAILRDVEARLTDREGYVAQLEIRGQQDTAELDELRLAADQNAHELLLMTTKLEAAGTELDSLVEYNRTARLAQEKRQEDQLQQREQEHEEHLRMLREEHEELQRRLREENELKLEQVRQGNRAKLDEAQTEAERRLNRECGERDRRIAELEDSLLAVTEEILDQEEETKDEAAKLA